MLRTLDDDSHVKTRISQYEALKNEKAEYIAKQFVLGKLEGQNQVLKKYGLRKHSARLSLQQRRARAERIRYVS